MCALVWGIRSVWLQLRRCSWCYFLLVPTWRLFGIACILYLFIINEFPFLSRPKRDLVVFSVARSGVLHADGPTNFQGKALKDIFSLVDCYMLMQRFSQCTMHQRDHCKEQPCQPQCSKAGRNAAAFGASCITCENQVFWKKLEDVVASHIRFARPSHTDSRDYLMFGCRRINSVYSRLQCFVFPCWTAVKT